MCLPLSASETFSLIGLGFDAVGVGLLLWNEVLTRRKDAAEDDLPRDFISKHYKASVSGAPVRPNTLEEDTYEKAAEAVPARRAFSLSIFGTLLILFGFALQVAGLLVG